MLAGKKGTTANEEGTKRARQRQRKKTAREKWLKSMEEKEEEEKQKEQAAAPSCLKFSERQKRNYRK